MGTTENDDESVIDSVVDDGPGDHTFDRRSMLKKVGIAGATAWVAPVVIESFMSPASAASIPPGVYRLNLSSQKCNPTPVSGNPASLVPPASCGTLGANWTAANFDLTTQAQLDSLGIVVSNCNARFDIQVNVNNNPKVTFTQAGSGKGNPRLAGQCQAPTVTPTQVTWLDQGSTDRKGGYFILVTVAP